jgi:hypothetical protein
VERLLRSGLFRSNFIFTQSGAKRVLPHAEASPLRPTEQGRLQRKCACGGVADSSGECEECRNKRRLGLQTKLKVNHLGDGYETEADRIADQVMAMSAGGDLSSAPHIRRLSAPARGQMDRAPASVDRAVASSGEPLEPTLRHDMEQRFGYDFAKVRVHSGVAAAQSAHDVDARAYTVGHNIVFGPGVFRPRTQEGRWILAHELTHVAQQSGTGARAVQMKRGKDSGQTKAKRRTILVIHARAGSKDGASALISGEPKPVPIELTYNALPEGDYTLVKRDIPETELVEYVNESGGAAAITWRRTKDLHGGERVRVRVQPQEFDFAEFARAEFEAVDPQIRNRLSKRGGQRLTTPEAQLGFSYFAKELKARGVTDEELILFQTRNRGGVNPRYRFDWANNWKDAVDQVLGSRGKLEKAAAANTETFATYGATFTGLSDEAYAIYKVSQLMPGFEETAEEQFKEAGTSVTEFETNRELLLEMFDERLRLETFAVLDKFEGGLLLTKERLVDSKEGRKQIDLARQAANRDDVKLLKSRSEEADRERDAAERAWVAAAHEFIFPSTDLLQLTRLHNKPSPRDALKGAEKTLSEKKSAAEEARQAYLGALQAVTGVPVASWRGFDVNQFFFGASADRSASILGRYITRKLLSVDRARKELQKDKRTIYKADMMVALTKEQLNVQQGSLVEKIVADRVEEYKSAPWWEKLLDVLSLALMFVPGAAVLRVAASTASVILTADNEAQAEVLFDGHVKSEGGSVASVAMSGIGLVGDVGDVARAVKGVGRATGILSPADEAAKAVPKTADVARAAGAKVEQSTAAKATPAPTPPVATPHVEPKTAPASIPEPTPVPSVRETPGRPQPAEAPTVAPPPGKPKPAHGKAPTSSQGIEEEAITAGKLAEYSFPHRGHTLRILKDGRIVRCSKLCTFTSLQEEFGDLIQRYPHLAEPMARLEKAEGFVAELATTRLAKRLEQIREAEGMPLADLEKLLSEPEFALQTEIGRDIHFVHYQRTGGKRTFEEWESGEFGGARVSFGRPPPSGEPGIEVARHGRKETFSQTNRTLAEQLKRGLLKSEAGTNVLSLQELRGKRVLDLAAGTQGRTVQDLRQAGIEAHGMDIALKEAAHPSYLRPADLVAEVPFEGEFDIAFELYGAFCYGLGKNTEKAFQNVISRLRPGGTLYIAPIAKNAQADLRRFFEEIVKRGGKWTRSENEWGDDIWRLVMPPAP